MIEKPRTKASIDVEVREYPARIKLVNKRGPDGRVTRQRVNLSPPPSVRVFLRWPRSQQPDTGPWEIDLGRDAALDLLAGLHELQGAADATLAAIAEADVRSADPSTPEELTALEQLELARRERSALLAEVDRLRGLLPAPKE